MTRPTTALTLAAVLMLVPAVQAKDKKPVDPDKRICRSTQPTGSFLTKSVCHTAAEWQRIDGTDANDARDTLDRAQRNGLGATGN